MAAVASYLARKAVNKTATFLAEHSNNIAHNTQQAPQNGSFVPSWNGTNAQNVARPPPSPQPQVNHPAQSSYWQGNEPTQATPPNISSPPAQQVPFSPPSTPFSQPATPIPQASFTPQASSQPQANSLAPRPPVFGAGRPPTPGQANQQLPPPTQPQQLLSGQNQALVQHLSHAGATNHTSFPPTPSMTPSSQTPGYFDPYAHSHQHHQHGPLTECPSLRSSDSVAFTTTWWRFKNIEDFGICSRCYQDKLANSPYTAWFEPFVYTPPSGTSISCDFSNERVNQLLYQASQTGNIQELYAYAQFRNSMGTACPGQAGVLGGGDLKWYTSHSIPDMSFCEPCYVEFVQTTSFANHFQPHPKQPQPTENWTCWNGWHFNRRTLVDCSRRNDWQSFVGWIQHFNKLQDCPNTTEVEANSRNWFKPNAIDGLRICEICFLEYFGGTSAAQNFHQVQQKWHQAPNVRCAMHPVAMKWLTLHLVEKDFNKWLQLAGRMATTLDCLETGIENGTFFLFDNPYTSESCNFKVCEKCYLGMFVSTNLDMRWSQCKATDCTILCDLHDSAPRYNKFIAKYTEAYLTQNLDVLVDYAVQMEKIPPCPGSAIQEIRTWYGTDLFNFCLECYEEVGRGSYFEKGFKWRGNQIVNQKCDMHSDNMRKRYAAACEQRNLMEFNEYCKVRERIFKERAVARATLEMSEQQAQSMAVIGNATAGQQAMTLGGSAGMNGQVNNQFYDPQYQQYQAQFTQAQSSIAQSLAAAQGMIEIAEAAWKQVE